MTSGSSGSDTENRDDEAVIDAILRSTQSTTTSSTAEHLVENKNRLPNGEADRETGPTSREIAREIGNRIRRARLSTRKLSRPKLAERMNIPTARLRQIEDGAVRASEMEIWLASLHIGCPLHELVPHGVPTRNVAPQLSSSAKQAPTMISEPPSLVDDPSIAETVVGPAARLAKRLRGTLRRHTAGTRFDRSKSERTD